MPSERHNFRDPDAMERLDNGDRLALAMGETVMDVAEGLASPGHTPDIRPDLETLRKGLVSMAAKVPLSDEQVHKVVNDIFNRMGDLRALFMERSES